MKPILQSLSNRVAGVPDFLRAFREGYTVLNAAHVTTESLLSRSIFRYAPPPLAAAYWRWYLGGERGETCFAAHARHASRELAEIAEEISAIIRASGIQTPTFGRLLRSILM